MSLMFDEIMRNLPSFGISGLLFVMWWFERQERSRTAVEMRDALRCAAQGVELSDRMIQVISANTEAVTALREELRNHRVIETEWFKRLSRQLEVIESK